jgi:hypothetical protein
VVAIGSLAPSGRWDMIGLPRHALILLLLAAVAGCGLHRSWNHSGAPQAALAQNPMYVPLSDREFLWNQLVDTIDDYFDIQREERVRLVGGVLTEGRIETFPMPGATLLEPWRKDSTHGFERWFASLQSIRRRAVITVRPQSDGGYLVEVAVYKELEELTQPEYSVASLPGVRHDETLESSKSETKFGAATIDWIPVGRDLALEQRILSQLRGRLGVLNAG